jgi:hypothetical protein
VYNKRLALLGDVLTVGGFIGSILLHILLVSEVSNNYNPLTYLAFFLLCAMGLTATFLPLSSVSDLASSPDKSLPMASIIRGQGLSVFSYIRLVLLLYALGWFLLTPFLPFNGKLVLTRGMSAVAITWFWPLLQAHFMMKFPAFFIASTRSQ